MTINGHRGRYKGRFIILVEDFPEHHKVAGLSDGAFRVFVEAVCFSRRNRTDGYLTAAQLKRLATGRPRVIGELCRAGLIEHLADGYQIHDWPDYQTTEEELAEISAKRSKAGQRSARARWG